MTIAQVRKVILLIFSLGMGVIPELILFKGRISPVDVYPHRKALGKTTIRAIVGNVKRN